MTQQLLQGSLKINFPGKSVRERKGDTHGNRESSFWFLPLGGCIGLGHFFYCFSETISRELDRKWNQRHSISANMGCWLYLLLHCQSPDPAIFLLREQSPKHIQIFPYAQFIKAKLGNPVAHQQVEEAVMVPSHHSAAEAEWSTATSSTPD